MQDVEFRVEIVWLHTISLFVMHKASCSDTTIKKILILLTFIPFHTILERGVNIHIPASNAQHEVVFYNHHMSQYFGIS